MKSPRMSHHRWGLFFFACYILFMIGSPFPGPYAQTACTNPSPSPGSGLASPCPVFGVTPASLDQTQSLTVTLTPQASFQYLWSTLYLLDNGQWKPVPLGSGWITQSGSYPIGDLSNYQIGVKYLAEWDWTWNPALGCYTGPGSNACNQGTWRVQSFVLASPASTLPPTVSVSIAPTSVSLDPGATQQFVATVTGSTNTMVAWSTTGGTISSSGFYAAPSAAGTNTVTATSQADTNKSVSASVTVNPQSAIDARPRDSYGWVSCNTNGGFSPLTDTQAAALVTPAAENRSANAIANQHKPSSAELSAYLNNEKDKNGQLPAQANPYAAYVTGGFTGTTDEIIQWAAIKWGIPPDWVRAEYVQESNWNQSELGDLTTVANPLAYPAYSRASGNQVYQSLGISQVKWNYPDVNDTGTGTEPLRWTSTAFNADYQASTLRFYFDNPQGLRSAWGDSTYSPCNNWLSLGGWYSPYPWNNSGQQSYVGSVQNQLANRTWTKPGF